MSKVDANINSYVEKNRREKEDEDEKPKEDK